MPPTQTTQVIQGQQKKAIALSSSSPSSPSKPLTLSKQQETEKFKIDVNPASLPADIPGATDAVDFAGVPIRVGMFVDVYFCKVVGLRASTDNRLNIVAVPGLHTIVTSDPENPLNGIADDKAVLLSGYHCIAYPDLSARAAKSAEAQTTLENLPPDVPEPLPSNFLTPSFS